MSFANLAREAEQSIAKEAELLQELNQVVSSESVARIRTFRGEFAHVLDNDSIVILDTKLTHLEADEQQRALHEGQHMAEVQRLMQETNINNPLFATVQARDIRLTEFLLSKGYTPNIQHDGKDLASMVLDSGDSNLLILLINHGMLPNFIQDSTLYSKLSQFNNEALFLLLEKDVVDLFCLFQFLPEDVVLLLLKKGIDPVKKYGPTQLKEMLLKCKNNVLFGAVLLHSSVVLDNLSQNHIAYLDLMYFDDGVLSMLVSNNMIAIEEYFFHICVQHGKEDTACCIFRNLPSTQDVISRVLKSASNSKSSLLLRGLVQNGLILPKNFYDNNRWISDEVLLYLCQKECIDINQKFFISLIPRNYVFTVKFLLSRGFKVDAQDIVTLKKLFREKLYDIYLLLTEQGLTFPEDFPYNECVTCQTIGWMHDMLLATLVRDKKIVISNQTFEALIRYAKKETIEQLFVQGFKLEPGVERLVVSMFFGIPYFNRGIGVTRSIIEGYNSIFRLLLRNFVTITSRDIPKDYRAFPGYNYLDSEVRADLIRLERQG